MFNNIKLNLVPTIALVVAALAVAPMGFAQSKAPAKAKAKMVCATNCCKAGTCAKCANGCDMCSSCKKCDMCKKAKKGDKMACCSTKAKAGSKKK